MITSAGITDKLGVQVIYLDSAKEENWEENRTLFLEVGKTLKVINSKINPFEFADKTTERFKKYFESLKENSLVFVFYENEEGENTFKISVRSLVIPKELVKANSFSPKILKAFVNFNFLLPFLKEICEDRESAGSKILFLLTFFLGWDSILKKVGLSLENFVVPESRFRNGRKIYLALTSKGIYLFSRFSPSDSADDVVKEMKEILPFSPDAEKHLKRGIAEQKKAQVKHLIASLHLTPFSGGWREKGILVVGLDKLPLEGKFKEVFADKELEVAVNLLTLADISVLSAKELNGVERLKKSPLFGKKRWS